MDPLCFFVSCVSHAFTSVHRCLVVTCWEKVDLLALVGDVYCIFVTFPCGIQGQVIVTRYLLSLLLFKKHSSKYAVLITRLKVKNAMH